MDGTTYTMCELGVLFVWDDAGLFWWLGMIVAWELIGEVAQKSPLTFRNIHHRQIQHFQQTVVCRENALGFCNLPQLPVKALDRVRGIDQTADLRRIFEVGAEVRPVFPP